MFTDFGTSFFTTNIAIQMKKPASDLSKDISLLIYIVIYFSNFYAGRKGVIYKNK